MNRFNLSHKQHVKLLLAGVCNCERVFSLAADQPMRVTRMTQFTGWPNGSCQSRVLSRCFDNAIQSAAQRVLEKSVLSAGVGLSVPATPSSVPKPCCLAFTPVVPAILGHVSQRGQAWGRTGLVRGSPTGAISAFTNVSLRGHSFILFCYSLLQPC